jgi:hypothetical protein
VTTIIDALENDRMVARLADAADHSPGDPAGFQPGCPRVAGDGGDDREQAEQPEDDSDGRSDLPQGGGGTEAEQGDQCEGGVRVCHLGSSVTSRLTRRIA